jgi:hypothetical protein
MIRIDNEGQRVAATDYWSTEHAARGLAYVSINAGALRLLLPEQIAPQTIVAARAARYAVLSRGPWSDHGGREGLELMLEDGSAEPWCLHLDARQCDRRWPASDDGRALPLTLWVAGVERESAQQVGELTVHLRSVPAIPWAQPMEAR